MEIIIAIVVLILLAWLGRWAIEEGVRSERQKQFMEDMKKWDNKRKKGHRHFISRNSALM